MPKHTNRENNRRWFWLAWAGVLLIGLMLVCLFVAEIIALIATARGG